ncbi:hypothetical protein Tco_0772806 [Tanacetum coccineum]|uniref:Uncharacterized protein n=1 Tax=Tanacetum coccineum TaxID=301880 RepID=A0ABQ4ZJT5_9ASTR
MASDSSSSQLPQLAPSSKVNFKCKEGIIAYNNVVALLEHPNILYHPIQVDDATKKITFSLSTFDKPLSFTHDDFISVIGLNYSKSYVSLPEKEIVRASLATLGLVDKDKPSGSEGRKLHSDHLTLLKPYTISAASFKKPLAFEVALTSHMLKAAKVLNVPEKSLILPSEEVNADDTTDKFLSGTNV